MVTANGLWLFDYWLMKWERGGMMFVTFLYRSVNLRPPLVTYVARSFHSYHSSESVESTSHYLINYRLVLNEYQVELSY